jgi:hypothetical protein
VHARQFDGELVILDLAKGEYLSLDAIGALLWNGLESGRTVEAIARDVVAQYEVSLEQATADLEALTDDLVAQGLLVEAAAG